MPSKPHGGHNPDPISTAELQLESPIVERWKKALQSLKNFLAMVWSPVKSVTNDLSFCKNVLGEGDLRASSGGVQVL